MFFVFLVSLGFGVSSKATRVRVRTPKAFAKQNRWLPRISHEVPCSAMRLRIAFRISGGVRVKLGSNAG
jgi:hypothetical protein